MEQECVDVESACAGASSGVAPVEDAPERDAMQLYAATVQNIGKHVGMFPIAVWACVRRRPIQVLFGDGLLDVVSTNVPWAQGTMLPGAIPRVPMLCRVMRFPLHG